MYIIQQIHITKRKAGYAYGFYACQVCHVCHRVSGADLEALDGNLLHLQLRAIPAAAHDGDHVTVAVHSREHVDWRVVEVRDEHDARIVSRHESFDALR